MHDDREEMFLREYGRLNDKQRQAVDLTEGPVMVVAGPGTGKTQILTLRIANILRKSDVPADTILALTFTNAAAANMRKRLVSIIGSDAYRVSIHTFHSFANHLIDTYPEHFRTIVGFSNCSDIERLDIIRGLLMQGRYELLKPIGNPFFHALEIRGAIQHLKREGITPEAFTMHLERERNELNAREDRIHTKGAHKGKVKSEFVQRERSLDKSDELALLYARYQEELLRRKRYDFEDSLLALIRALEENESFLRELQEEYQYFLVDEHQDTNGAQNRILELLATYFEEPNLFIVGDEKQAIFRFQGASLANFLYFEQKFRNVVRITLDTNYRSHQGVLDAAADLIAKNKEGVHAPLAAHDRAERRDDPRIKIYKLDADEEELLYLAQAVKAKIEDGVPPHEIAVLYRNNRDAEEIADYFERLSIPYIVAADHAVLDDPDVRKINVILEALEDLNDNDRLAKLLFVSFLGVSVPDAYALIREARSAKRTLFDTLTHPGALTLEDSASVRTLADRLTSWKRSAENDPFLRFFETVVRESGILAHIQRSPYHLQKFDKLVQLFDELKALTARTPFFGLAEYRAYLTILEEHGLTFEAKPRSIQNAVPLMTAHKGKGLEFDYVFIVHAHDGNWGNKRKPQFFRLPYGGSATPSDTASLDDERRLFYVALTRARRDVFISYASVAPDGRERVPSRFIEEIDPRLRVTRTSEDVGVKQARPPLFVVRTERTHVERYLEFVRAHFAESGFSATSLNNYLTCPWRWFYSNFLRTQFVRTVHQEKGTAVHRALEDYFVKRERDHWLPVDYLLERFSHHVEETELDPLTKERVTRDTTTHLKGWHTTWESTFTERSLSELAVSGVIVRGVTLTGKIDKLECLDDRCNAVRVVDYKTGAPKSRNEIEGTTERAKSEAGSGGYKRQLVFYKILLDAYAGGKYRMEEAMLDFIEPLPSGTYRRERFNIPSSDAQALQDTIEHAAHEIRELTFWDTRCSDPSCEYCALRDLMETH